MRKSKKKGIGKHKVNYKIRDAVFSRQRYWGEPFPVYYKNGMPYILDESELPLVLPIVDKYLPTETGEPPLARAENWKTKDGYDLDCHTMPGWAGSSWYYLRYMDPHNENEFLTKKAVDYWQNVDLYIGGAEHATGHLMYVRFWTKFLYDLGVIPFDEPAKKLINQGMIQGMSAIIYKCKEKDTFVSSDLIKDADKSDYLPVRVHIDLIAGDNIVNDHGFKNWKPEYKDAKFIHNENGEFRCDREVEKMSKSKHNVVNPDNIILQYGADTLRLYEMFLGPIEQAKPWDTHGIEGVSRFMRKLWRLYYDREDKFIVSDDKPTNKELKILHRTIKKVQEDIKRYSFNTGVSALMICVNELTELKCNKKAILEDLAVIISPYAPHITEELWSSFRGISDDKQFKESISKAAFPQYKEEYIAEETCTYPVSFNGKKRFTIDLPVDMPPEEIEKEVLTYEKSKKWLNGKKPKKVIIVKKRIVNIVI
ncbi:MAG: class I tRNA ligase family protein [Bacteroidota bacterium]